MPIMIIGHEREGHGLRSFPAVFCDYCHARIGEAKNGNYYWRYQVNDNDGKRQQDAVMPIFLHKKCDTKICDLIRHDGLKTIQFAVGEIATKDFREFSWMELIHFPIFMARNLELEVSCPFVDGIRSDMGKIGL